MVTKQYRIVKWYAFRAGLVIKLQNFGGEYEHLERTAKLVLGESN
jgi:hypothetical protein